MSLSVCTHQEAVNFDEVIWRLHHSPHLYVRNGAVCDCSKDPLPLAHGFYLETPSHWRFSKSCSSSALHESQSSGLGSPVQDGGQRQQKDESVDGEVHAKSIGSEGLENTSRGRNCGCMIAKDLMASGFAEDKLSCVLVYQTKLIPKNHVVWRDELPVFVSFFEKGWICNWSSCDALCMRVLANLVKHQKEESEKEACAQAIASWHHSDLVWQKRASVVSFVTLAKHGDRNFPKFKEMLLEACAGVVKSNERFAQTGVGWVVREIGKGDEKALLEFVKNNLSEFSREGLRYSLEKVSKKERAEIMDQHKSLKRSGDEQTSATRKKSRR
ncbi:hypothetical protein BSKO_03224 [Bryopsis sp. KO-2023]|nr:hypothetical protein BSKO_03224 [Bryopsis sp. KO-2023]